MKKKPQYVLIKEYILNNIEDNVYQENGKIASEHELCEIFGVTRMTVRQAISDLVADNILYSVPKIGSFVCKKSKFKNFDGLNSFSEDSARKKGSATSVVVLNKKEVGSPEILNEMGLKPNASLHHVKRVRLSDNETVAFEDDYINTQLVEKLSDEVVENSLFNYFENELGYEISYSDQQIDACIAGPELAKYLKIDENAPLLRVLSITRLNDGQTIEYGYTYYRVDKYTFNQVAYRKR